MGSQARTLVMDCPCGKFGDCSFSRFGSIMQTDTQTDRQTDADECFTPATLVGESNECSLLELLQPNSNNGFSPTTCTHKWHIIIIIIIIIIIEIVHEVHIKKN